MLLGSTPARPQKVVTSSNWPTSHLPFSFRLPIDFYPMIIVFCPSHIPRSFHCHLIPPRSTFTFPLLISISTSLRPCAPTPMCFYPWLDPCHLSSICLCSLHSLLYSPVSSLCLWSSGRPDRSLVERFAKTLVGQIQLQLGRLFNHLPLWVSSTHYVLQPH